MAEKIETIVTPVHKSYKTYNAKKGRQQNRYEFTVNGFISWTSMTKILKCVQDIQRNK